MKIWFERGPIGDAVSFGFQFCWEDKHLSQYRLSFDFGPWYFNIYIRLKHSTWNKGG